jgi:hypothetical protein
MVTAVSDVVVVVMGTAAIAIDSVAHETERCLQAWWHSRLVSCMSSGPGDDLLCCCSPKVAGSYWSENVALRSSHLLML